MIFTSEHEELRRTVRTFVEKELNPHVRTWEDAGRFPIHEVFKKMGELGLLGVTKPTEYGGQGLDYSYGMVMAEEMGRVHCGGCAARRGGADRHGHAGARALRQRRAAAGVPGSGDCR